MNKIISAITIASALAFPFVSFASDSITLQGGDVTVYQGQSYNEPGYTANSTVDGDITSEVQATAVDTSHPGDTGRSYSVTDSASDTATAFRSVKVLGVGASSPCLFERNHYANQCIDGWYAPNQQKPIVAQILDGELMPVVNTGITSFVPATTAYKVKFLADKNAAKENGTIDTWFQNELKLATN